MTTTRGIGLATAAVTAVLLAGCMPPAEDADPDDEESSTPTPTADPTEPVAVLDVEFFQGSPQFTNEGAANVSFATETLAGGRLRVVRGRDNLPALRTPSYAGKGDYPRAVLTIVGSGASDPFSPGEQDFSWGADVRVDRNSFGRDEDNGDNLLQRGLNNQSAQFKAEVDELRPGCTVKGDAGQVVVRADLRLRPMRWYRVQCSRSGEAVTVAVTEFTVSGAVGTKRKTDKGNIGSLDFEPDVPVTLGGKVGGDGRIVAGATDQFNGRIMNPSIKVGSSSD